MFGGDLFEAAFDVTAVADIEREERGIQASLPHIPGDRVPLLLLAIADDDARAAPRERLGNAQAQALRRAGH